MGDVSNRVSPKTGIFEIGVGVPVSVNVAITCVHLLSHEVIDYLTVREPF